MTQQIGRVADIRRVIAVRIRGGNASRICFTGKEPVEDAHGVGDVDVAIAVAVAPLRTDGLELLDLHRDGSEELKHRVAIAFQEYRPDFSVDLL